MHDHKCVELQLPVVAANFHESGLLNTDVEQIDPMDLFLSSQPFMFSVIVVNQASNQDTAAEMSYFSQYVGEFLSSAFLELKFDEVLKQLEFLLGAFGQRCHTIESQYIDGLGDQESKTCIPVLNFLKIKYKPSVTKPPLLFQLD